LTMAWQLLFSVTVEHDFFSSAHDLQLNFQPDQTTAHLLRNADLLFRTDTNRFSVCFASNALEILESFSASSIDGLDFTFKVIALDPHFLYYTDWQADVSPWYRNAPTSDAATELLLVNALIADRIELSAFMVTINISKENIIKAKEYSISLKARATYWKYYLLGKLAEKETKIIDLAGKEHFYCAGVQRPFPDVPAMVFYSMEKIPLQERPSQRFQLRQQGSAGDKVLIKHLQNAGSENLAKEFIHEKEVYVSEVYINP
jgi:hypothetical protein